MRLACLAAVPLLITPVLAQSGTGTQSNPYLGSGFPTYTCSTGSSYFNTYYQNTDNAQLYECATTSGVTAWTATPAASTPAGNAGTITGVTVTAPLTGGGTSGPVTIAVPTNTYDAYGAATSAQAAAIAASDPAGSAATAKAFLTSLVGYPLCNGTTCSASTTIPYSTISGTPAATAPGGSSGQVQTNNSGAFGALAFSGLAKFTGGVAAAGTNGVDYQQPAVTRVFGSFCFGDSTYYGFGTVTALGVFCNALAQDIPGPEGDQGVSGYYTEQIAPLTWQYWSQTTNLNELPYIAYEGGVNDSNQTNGSSGGGGNTTGALQNASWAITAGVAHLTIPLASQQMSSTASGSGTWTTFTNGSYLTINPAMTGTMMSSATNGSTRTYSLPAGANVAYTWIGQDSDAGTFTVSLNGTLQTNKCTGTTTFTAAGCSSAAIVVNGGYSFFAQVFAGGNTGSSNTLVVTVTSSSGTIYDVAAATVPASTGTSPIIGLQGVLKQYNETGGSAIALATAAYDTAVRGVVTDLSGKGFSNIFLVDVRNGVPASAATPGVAAQNTTTDFVSSSCAGGTAPLHPNECFNQRLAKMHEAAAATAGLPIATPNAGTPLLYSRNILSSNLTSDFRYDLNINAGLAQGNTLRSPGIGFAGNSTYSAARISYEYSSPLAAYSFKIASQYDITFCGLYGNAGGQPSYDYCGVTIGAYARTGAQFTAPIRAGVGGGFDTYALTSQNSLAITWESQQRVNTATSACTALICYVGSSVTTLTLPACGTNSSNYNGNYWQDYINDSGATISSLTLSASTAAPVDLINGAATKVYTSVVPYQRLHVQCSRATATASDISVTSTTP